MPIVPTPTSSVMLAVPTAVAGVASSTYGRILTRHRHLPVPSPVPARPATRSAWPPGSDQRRVPEVDRRASVTTIAAVVSAIPAAWLESWDLQPPHGHQLHRRRPAAMSAVGATDAKAVFAIDVLNVRPQQAPAPTQASDFTRLPFDDGQRIGPNQSTGDIHGRRIGCQRRSRRSDLRLANSDAMDDGIHRGV